MKKEDREGHSVDLSGGGKALILFSRPLWLHGVDRRRPLRLEITVPIVAPGSTGMPEGPENDELEGIEFRLVQLVTKRAKGEHVMIVTGAGEQTHVFYLAPLAGRVRKRDTRELLEPLIAKVAEQADRPLTSVWADDPEWTRFLGIYPTYDPVQWRADRALLTHMAKASDAIHIRRLVAHRVYFDARDQCPGFLREARRLRFKPEGGPKKAAAGSPGAWVVVVQRLEPTIATWHLHPVVLSLKALAIDAGGTYDGWETEFVQSLVPPPLTAPGGRG